jgi:hypothetical protein
MIGPAISLSAVGENALDFSWIPAQSFAQPPRRVERYGAASRHRLHPSAIPMHTVDIHRWSIVYAAVDFKRSERMQLMEGKP